ncbi:hypothetical protein Fcan01_11472 [Folsomia candida]|uniref:Uncharacterized protein n=1 Tax=Folsomia candida TaxID=158441 RepID=A0A226EB58_FOLCA|nr:hypothetical protein Fcan01_11472 [Folsomia candida]
MITFAGLLASGIGLVILVIGDDVVATVNAALDLYDDFRKMEDKPLANSRDNSKTNILQKSIRIEQPRQLAKTIEGNLDKAGLLCLTVFTTTIILAHIMAPIVVFMDYDAMNFILRDIWDALGIWNNVVVRVLSFCFRMANMYIFYMEVQRILPFIIFVLGIAGQMGLKSLGIVLRHAENARLGRTTLTTAWITRYRGIQVLVKVPEVPLAVQTFVLMALGLCLSASMNFASIRFLDYGLNPLFYIRFPFYAIVILLIIIALLPLAIRANTTSGQIITYWKNRVRAQGERRLISTTLRALRPVKVYAGVNGTNLFEVDKPVLGTYLSSIIDWTITLLITFPRDQLQLNFGKLK